MLLWHYRSSPFSKSHINKLLSNINVLLSCVTKINKWCSQEQVLKIQFFKIEYHEVYKINKHEAHTEKNLLLKPGDTGCFKTSRPLDESTKKYLNVSGSGEMILYVITS